MVTGDKIADLKESYPILQKRPQKVYSHLQKKINLISNIQVLKFSGIPINILLECNKSAYFLRNFFFFLQIHVLNSLQIIKITKHRSVRFVKRRTRSALDNFLGKSLMFVLDTMLWVSEGIKQCLEPKAITTSEKHVQTSPISTEKSPEMAWVDKVKNININENIYMNALSKTFLLILSFVTAKDIHVIGWSLN